MPQTRLVHAAAAGFEAARKVERLPPGHRSRRLHGHSFLAKLRATVPPASVRFPGDELAVLRQMLAAAVAPLDYELLNARVATPTDENLARWLRQRVPLTEVDSIGVQSTRDAGVDLDRREQAHLWRRYAFQAAHRLPNVPAGHQCGRMHGHGFEVILHAMQHLRSRDLGLDYDRLDALWTPLAAELDYACLNDLEGLANPTSELISSWLWDRLKPQLPELSWVTVYETASCGAHFDGARYRIWKELSLDSAVRLERAPEGDPRRRIHGHTYTLRLHLNAPLDQVLGWTIDFGDVKALFAPVFRQLDHQPLYELAGAGDNDLASLLGWIKAQCHASLPALDRIDLYEARGCGAILAWGSAPPALPI